jgi:hypothetical protein
MSWNANETAPGDKRRAYQFGVMEVTIMKILGVISTTALFFLLGAPVPAFAQDHEEAAKPAQHEEQAKPVKAEAQGKPEQQQQQAKPEQRQEQTKSAKEQTQAKPAQQRQQAKPEQRQEQAKTTKPATQARPAKQEARGNTTAHVQRTAAEQQRQRAVPALRLSARGNSRIPDDRFRSNFGRGHEFRIGSPTVVDGYSRFQYGGYWFGFVQPWPADWYYTDDVYVDYINGGYYLCNPSYPGTQIAISVVL